MGVESHGRAIQRDERANEDTGAAEQDDGHGDLHDDERLSHTGRVTGLRAARPQRVGHRSPREQDRRCEAGDRACRERQAERVDQHASIDEQLGDAEQVRGGHGEQRVETPAREREAERAAGAGEQQAFDQQRSRNRPASRPE